MTKQHAVVVFVKTPGLSSIKTRLAISIGKEKAEEFYFFAVKAVESVLKEAARKNPSVSLFWAVAEENGLQNPLWQSFQRIFQGDGNFGERLHHVYSNLLKNYHSVTIIGADSPQIQTSHLEKANTILNQKEEKFVIGPAFDGGFYLFGGRTPISKQVWTDTHYSQENTLALLRENLMADEKLVLLESARDVDNLEDLIALREHFPSTCNLDQKRLLNWITSQYIGLAPTKLEAK